MTLQEFKAWFEGFTEELRSAPSVRQWERIKKRVAEIDGTMTPYPVFMDRYYPNVWLGGYGVGISGNQSLENTATNHYSHLSCVSKGAAVGSYAAEEPIRSFDFSAAQSFKTLGSEEFREVQ